MNSRIFFSKHEKSKVTARFWQGLVSIIERRKEGNVVTVIATEIQKWKRNKTVWGIFILTALLGVFVVERACHISKNSPLMDSFGDLYTLAFKSLTSLFLPVVLGIFSTTLFFDEHKNDTLKALLIIPVSKMQLYFSKVAVVILMSMGLSLFIFVFCIVGGLVAGGFPDFNAETVKQAGVLFIAGGLFIPIALFPVIFLAALSKGYVLPIGATLLYLMPVVIAPSALIGIHPLASLLGIYACISDAALEMAETWAYMNITAVSPVSCMFSMLLTGAFFAVLSVAALHKQSY